MNWVTHTIRTAGKRLTSSFWGAAGIGAGIGAVFSLINCFFGYRLLRVWIGAAGFMAGVWCGFGAADYFLDNDALCAIIALAAGVTAAFLALRIYLAGVFLLCGLLAMAVCSFLGNMLFSQYGTAVFLMSLAAGAAAGAVAVLFSRPVIILVTAVSGGLAASQTLFGMFGMENETAILAVGTVISVLGAAWQFHQTKGK